MGVGSRKKPDLCGILSMKNHGIVLWDGDQEETWAKDWEISKFLLRFFRVAPVVERMRSFLPDGKKTYLVDMIAKDHRVGDPTCRDVRWHFDGDYGGGNVYALWAKGSNRTEFPETIPELDPPDDRESQNRYLEGLGLKGVEVPEMSVITYDSSTPHRGIICRVSGKRMFVRVLGTDTIRAKNFIGRKA
jgi:hypothetical protein